MAKKRGQNEGSIYHRKDGLWSSQISSEGKRVSKYFKTRREAQQWLDETRSQMRNGLSLAGASASMSEFFEHWLETVKSSLRPNTHAQYSQIVHQHILPLLGKVRLKDLRPDMIQTLYNEKLSSGVSARTVQLIHAVLHRSLNQALKWGLIGRNPADAVVRPKARRAEMKVLDDVQVRTLLLAAKGSRFEALLQVAVTTGLREGEILGLKWSDLDWTTRRLQIQRQVQRQKGKGNVFSEPKTAAGRRSVVLGSGTIEKLREHYQKQQVERQIAGDRWQENDLIFPSVIGTPQDHRNVLKSFKEILEQAGLPIIRFHDLRHTAATLMLQQDVHPKVVQERLGHSEISLTLNTYSHVLPDMQEEAAEALEGLITLVDVSGEVGQVCSVSKIMRMEGGEKPVNLKDNENRRGNFSKIVRTA